MDHKARQGVIDYWRIVVISVWLSAGVSLALAASPASAPFQPATAGYQYIFPRDHGSHPTYRTEWWYYTGHLHAQEGRSFGFELTFFRRGIPPEDVTTLPSKWSVKDLYLAHFAVTDIKGKRFHFSEKLSREGIGKAGADESKLQVWIDDWRAGAATDVSGVHTLIA